ncbi:hypothetical protein D3C77_69400 [compost metagenome]
MLEHRLRPQPRIEAGVEAERVLRWHRQRTPVHRGDPGRVVTKQLQQGREDVVVAGAVFVGRQVRLPVEGVQALALDHHQRHQALLFHRVAVAVRIQAGVAAFVQVLAVVGGVDEYRLAKISLGEQAIEELADIPQQAVHVRIAVQHPVFGLTGKPIAPAGIGDVGVLPARQGRAVGHEVVRVLVVHGEMHANLVDHDQLRLFIAQQFSELGRCGHVAVAHRGAVELDELVDVAFFRRIHQVLQVAARALGIDVHGAKPCDLGVLPDRRQGRVDAQVVVAGAAIAQGDVGVGAAIGNRGGVAIVEDTDPGARLVELAAYAMGGVQVQVIARDAFVDDQHDVAGQGRAAAGQGHRFARADAVVQRFVEHQVGVGQWRVHDRQATGPLAGAHEQDRGEQGDAQQRRGPRQCPGPWHAVPWCEPQAQQQQQRPAQHLQDHAVVLLDGFTDKTTGIHHRDKAAVGQVVGGNARVGIEKHRAGAEHQGQAPAQPGLADVGAQQQGQHQQHQYTDIQQQRRAQADGLKALDVVRVVAQQVQREQQFLEISVHLSLASNACNCPGH